MPAPPQSPARTEQDYLQKASSYTIKIALWLMITLITLPIIFLISNLFHTPLVIIVNLLPIVIYIYSIPIQMEKLHRVGLGIWMGHAFSRYDSTIIYIGFLGLFAAAIENGLIYIGLDGINRFLLSILIVPIISLLFFLIGAYILFRYQKRMGINRRFLWLTEEIYAADGGFHKALASLNLKTSVVRVITKYARYSTNQIDDYSIQYNFKRERGITTIELNPTKPEFLSKLPDIEKAVSAQFGLNPAPND